MRDGRQDELKDALPDWVAGRLPAEEARRVGEAVRADEELSAEARMLERLMAARPEPPEGLAGRISSAVREAGAPEGLAGATPGPSRRRGASGLPLTRWGLVAAAAALVVFGTLEVAERRLVPRAGGEPLDRIALEDAPSPWITDDGSGPWTPVLLDELSEEDLNTLLEELGG